MNAAMRTLVAATVLAAGSPCLHASAQQGPAVPKPMRVTAQANAGTVGVISGGVQGTYVRIAADLASVLDDGAQLRILPIIGRASVQNIADMLFLRGVDVAIVQADVLAYMRRERMYPGIERTVQYITKLYDEEVHILARADIARVEDLAAQPVNVDVAGSGTSMTATVVFDALGIQPQMLLCRCDRPVPDAERRKIASFCNVRPQAVIGALDVDTIYAVPISYHQEGMDREVLRHFGLPFDAEPDLSAWQRIVDIVRAPEGEVHIAVVGKYTNLLDSYKSLSEALIHGGVENRVRVHLDWVMGQIFEQPDAVARLEGVHGILVPGGFGERGTEGKIAAVRFARERRVPFFGICFGMQMAVIECARNQVGLADASSTEFGPCGNPVVGLLTEWARGNEMERREEGGNLGGTMRLGAYPADLASGSLVSAVYGGATRIEERHRHRWEVNVHYREGIEAQGLRFSGMSPDGILPEIVERPDHPWFIGVQYHPELKSKPLAPHPLFSGFIRAAVKQSRLV